VNDDDTLSQMSDLSPVKVKLGWT